MRDLLDAQDGSAARDHELFYAQSWLASQPGAIRRRLEPRQIYDHFALEGSAAMEVQLRSYLTQLTIQEPAPQPSPELLPGLAARELEEYEWQTWQLELLRGMKGNSAAEPELLTLESSHPQSPFIQAALGARSWNVNIAYIPYRGKGPLIGEAHAILF